MDNENRKKRATVGSSDNKGGSAMRAITILRRILSPFLRTVHAKRLEAVFKVVEALLAGNRVTMSALGRATRGAAKPRHKIKRVDRLLGNEKLLERDHAVLCMA